MSLFSINEQLLQEISAIIQTSDKNIVMPMLKPSNHAVDAAEIIQKGIVGEETDHVTNIDTNNEAYLLAQFRQYLPMSFAVGEESFDSDPAYNIQLMSTSDYSWILDPIDGTNNVVKYLKGETTQQPRYGIMAALLNKGVPVAGWIYTSDDQGKKQMACGATDVGAFTYDLDAGKLQPLTLATQQESPVPHVVTTLSAWPKKFQPIVEANIAEGKVTLYPEPPKAASHEMMYLLEGKVTAAAFRQFRMWDHLPGLVIVKAAGGKAALFNGASPMLADQRNNGILLTAKANDFADTRQALLGDVVYDQTENPKQSPGLPSSPQPK